jgi:hypothetical protein
LPLRLLAEAVAGLFQQFFQEAGSEGELLQAVLVAREVQQVVDQLHQTLHFLVDRSQQVGFPGFLGKAQAFLEQPEGHVHAGDRGTQFVGSAQHELTANPLECPLLGDIVEHHHRAKNMPLGVADRSEAVGQQARLAVDLDVQVIRGPFQVAAA